MLLVYRIVSFDLCKFGLMFGEFGSFDKLENGCSVCSAGISVIALFLGAIAIIRGNLGLSSLELAL